ncbi:hypothetical protein [Burkholderia territorii]|nr:hypothetical protein [Burkholderia territorii]
MASTWRRIGRFGKVGAALALIASLAGCGLAAAPTDACADVIDP